MVEKLATLKAADMTRLKWVLGEVLGHFKKAAGTWSQFKHAFSCILLAAIMLAACAPKEERSWRPPVVPLPAECSPRPDDPSGYLLRICEHILAENITMLADPNTLSIREIENVTCPRTMDGTCREGQSMIRVRLSCCFMGDDVYFDAESGELLFYSKGDI